jgi:hypothetical protein
MVNPIPTSKKVVQFQNLLKVEITLKLANFPNGK